MKKLILLILLSSLTVYNANFPMNADETKEESLSQKIFLLENLVSELKLEILNQRIISIVNQSSSIFEAVNETSKYLKNINLLNTNFNPFIKDLIKAFKYFAAKKFAGNLVHLSQDELNKILEKALLEENLEEAAKALLAKADPDIKFKVKMEQDIFYELDPLYLSTDKESLQQLIPLLLIYGAKVNESKRNKVGTEDYQTALNLAVFNDKQAIVEQFLNYNVNINLPDSDGDTPLIIAVATDNISMINFLISKGAVVNYQNKAGNTPLAFAIVPIEFVTNPNKILVIKILLANKAKPNIKNKQGITALDRASSVMDTWGINHNKLHKKCWKVRELLKAAIANL